MKAVIDALSEHGIEASEVEEDGSVTVEIPCGDGDGQRDCHELIGEIETRLLEQGLPFVPEEIDGRIVIRPPAS